MDTIVRLSEEELSELKDLTQESDTFAALHRALREYIRYAKRMRLKALAGRVTMDDNWKELEELE